MSTMHPADSVVVVGAGLSGLIDQHWNSAPWTGGAFTNVVTPGSWTSHARQRP